MFFCEKLLKSSIFELKNSNLHQKKANFNCQFFHYCQKCAILWLHFASLKMHCTHANRTSASCRTSQVMLWLNLKFYYLVSKTIFIDFVLFLLLGQTCCYRHPICPQCPLVQIGQLLGNGCSPRNFLGYQPWKYYSRKVIPRHHAVR